MFSFQIPRQFASLFSFEALKTLRKRILSEYQTGWLDTFLFKDGEGPLLADKRKTWIREVETMGKNKLPKQL